MSKSARPNAADPLPRWGAFAYPDYRLYWVASLVRVFAIQFRIIGTLWLVAVELDRSPAWVGIVMLSAAVPTIVLVVPFGHLADRLDNRLLLITSSAVSALLHLMLAVLVVSGVIELWMVIVWSVATGSMNALMAPAQNAILPQLIDMRAIASAVAFSSSIWNGMRVIGPAAAGVIIAVMGTGQAFFVTAAGYAIATALTVALRPAPRAVSTRVSEGNPLLEGARYVLANRLFVAVIGLSFFTSLFGSSYQVLLPFFANDILDVGEIGFGLLEAAAGLGAILGTIAIVKFGASRYRGQVMLFGAMAFGLLVTAFAVSEVMALSLGLLFGAGFAASVYLNLGMTTLQLEVPDELRGRVMGIWSMTWNLAWVGGAVAGGIAALIGTPATVAFGGLSVAGFAAVLLFASSELRNLSTAPAAVPAR
ncbi:MAG: MFS transporter [Chloroflexi bacterium]|nr:MFS transporter [Chloroflexota bacterium]